MNQLQAFLIYLKNMKIIWLAALLILIAQLFSTKMVMIFTHEQKMVARIEVVNQDKGDASTVFLDKLSQNPEFEFVEKESFKINHLLKSSSQGLLVINDNFTSDYLKGNQKVLDFYVASGIQNTGTIREVFSASLLQMIAQEDFKQKIKQLDGSENSADFSLKELFQVELHQIDEKQSANKNKIPLHLFGLFLLIFVLLILSLLPGMDLRQFRFFGKKILLQQQFLVLTIVFLVGFLLINSFLLLMPMLVSTTFSTSSFSMLVALLIYILGLATLLINLNLRQISVFLFIPWFILNMTIGGGLWGVVSLPSFMNWLFPLNFVIKEHPLSLISYGILFLLLAFLAIIFSKQRQFNSIKNILKR